MLKNMRILMNDIGIGIRLQSGLFILVSLIIHRRDVCHWDFGGKI